jgi:hypothetical protein
MKGKAKRESKKEEEERNEMKDSVEKNRKISRQN